MRLFIGQRWGRRLFWIFPLVVGLLAVSSDVGWLHLQPDRARSLEVRGVLLDLQASSLVYADSLTLRDEAGQIYDFRVDPEVSVNREQPQSSGHLRQHMALGEPMLIRYHVEMDGTLVAFRILDAS